MLGTGRPPEMRKVARAGSLPRAPIFPGGGAKRVIRRDLGVCAPAGPSLHVCRPFWYAYFTNSLHPMPEKTTLDDVLHAVNESANFTERRFQEVLGRLDRIERIVESWPPPSLIRDLLERVAVLERLVRSKPRATRS